jgi:acetyltransferase-like isoleucine patch superfamily enzyme
LQSIRRIVNYLRICKEKQISRWIVYFNDIKYAGLPVIKGKCYIRNDGYFEIGKNLLIRSGFKQNPTGLKGGGFAMTIELGGKVIIGDNVGISNSTIYCKRRISIGSDCLIGTDCKIYDSDFHSVNYLHRNSKPEVHGKSYPVNIGNSVFIGTNVIILKGVSIGDRSVIGAGSVLSTSVPADELWAGNPAVRIRSLL